MPSWWGEFSSKSILGVGSVPCFGSALLPINSGGLGNDLVIGSGYSTPLVPDLIESLGVFVTVASHDHMSSPVLVSKLIIVGISILGVGSVPCFGSAPLPINSGGLGNDLVIGSGYSTPLVPDLIESLGVFVTVASHDHMSSPVLVFNLIIVGISSITMGFISFPVLPEDVTPLHASGTYVFFALLWDLVCTKNVDADYFPICVALIRSHLVPCPCP